MKRVLVIGGGFAGSTVARKLETRFDVTLVDTKDYFEFTPGILRTLVEPSHLRKIQVMHNHYLKRAKFIRSEVSELRLNEATLDDGKKISFDYAVICSGSKYNSPIKEQDVVIATRAEHLRKASSALSKAKDVVIIGGGLVGVELAAEIACRHKNVTIIQARERLMERQPAKAAKYAERFLLKQGVQIRYNELVKGKNSRTFTTDKGSASADIAFWCTGISPNFDFMKRHFGNALNERGMIKVNDRLQVLGAKHVFSAGDVTDRMEEKTAQNAERQAKVVVRNILALESGNPLAGYVSKSTPIVLSLGKWRGILTKGDFVWYGFLPAFLKWAVERREMLKLRF